MAMNRRRFLERVSRTAVATGLLSPLRCLGGPSSIPIVDTHQHLWDLSKFQLRWLSPPLDRSFTTKDYVEATQGLGVVKAVYMEVAVPPPAAAPGSPVRDRVVPATRQRDLWGRDCRLARRRWF